MTKDRFAEGQKTRDKRQGTKDKGQGTKDKGHQDFKILRY